MMISYFAQKKSSLSEQVSKANLEYVGSDQNILYHIAIIV
jgi:hypothetical protein